MTGGQMSPTMEIGDKATTAPHGQVERPFDLCRLAEAAGATYVARGTAGHIRQMEKLIKHGVEHTGFSFVEAVVPCPTEYGRRNTTSSAVKMLEDERARSISKAAAAKLTPQELAGKIVSGVLFQDKEAPEFQASYAALVRAQTKVSGTSPLEEEK
jgi:2-oxoglutarate ferredoxin oxidoreductase subunit beta